MSLMGKKKEGWKLKIKEKLIPISVNSKQFLTILFFSVTYKEHVVLEWVLLSNYFCSFTKKK